MQNSIYTINIIIRTKIFNNEKLFATKCNDPIYINSRIKTLFLRKYLTPSIYLINLGMTDYS